MASRTITYQSFDAPQALSEAERRAMFELLSLYYAEVKWANFLKDLEEKQEVIRLWDSQRVLVGFSTLQHIQAPEDEAIIVFSGDTVIHESCWGQNKLQQAFIKNLIRLKLAHPWRPVYWFLISKGYKTFLMIRKNFRCYPNPEGPTPVAIQARLDDVARAKFQQHYDAERGLVVFPECLGRVKEKYEDLSPEQRLDPDIAFFLERNPGWKNGDELCCLAQIRVRDLLAIVAKYFLMKPLRSLFWRKPKGRAKPDDKNPHASPKALRYHEGL